jgi:hypothetical protein
MGNNEKIILDLIVENIISEVAGISPATSEFNFIVEKILTNCGLNPAKTNEILEIVKKSIRLSSNSNYIQNVIVNDISAFVEDIFEATGQKRADKIAVRNKQSGAIQLVSKKTYQANSQIYTPLSAGWAKANVVMIRNKTSGEEYPILLKNFDSNKHEKVGTATPPEDKEENPELKPTRVGDRLKNKDKKQPKPEVPDAGKDTVRPIMLEPSLKSKTTTAFITPKSAKSQPSPPQFPDNEDDVISRIQQTVKDKKLSKQEPLKSPAFKYNPDEDENERYEKMKNAGVLPSDFNINKKFSIPNSITNKIKIPRGYINSIEQLVNSVKGDVTPVSAYSLPIPLNTNPNATVSLFELLLLYSVTLNDEDFSKFTITIDTFLNSNRESNLTNELWDAVKSERTLILKYTIKKYGDSFDIIAGAWKVEEHQLELGVDDSDLDTERISDIFLRVNTEDDYDALEEFVVTPNRNNMLAKLDKLKFKDYIGKSEDKIKAKLLTFILKMFPMQAILKNEMTVVFPDVIYDYLTLSELFKTTSIDNLGLKLKGKSKNIDLIYTDKSNLKKIIQIKINDTIDIEINSDFANNCASLNKKIYKIK